MKYQFVERPVEYQNLWFEHQIELYVVKSTWPVLVDFLNQHVGLVNQAWYREPSVEHKFSILDRNPLSLINFSTKRQAMMFKMLWDEEPRPSPEFDWLKWYTKLNVNSVFGKMPSRSATISVGPQWIIPDEFFVKTISNPCNEILLPQASSWNTGASDDDAK